jgi:hypothetical protein
MTTDHDSDPDATVRMPRPPAPKKEVDLEDVDPDSTAPKQEADLEDVDPDSTLIRDDWGNVTIPPAPNAIPIEQPPPAVPPLQEWERTLRRPAYAPDKE